MEKIKKILPSKAFFRGILFALVATQFVDFKINIAPTSSYYSVKDNYNQLTGGVEVEQEISDISVVPDVFAVIEE